MRKGIAVAVGVAVLAVGCTDAQLMTGYDSNSHGEDAVRAVYEADGSIVIIASANRYTPDVALQDFLLLRASETVLAEGGRCFVEVSTGGSRMNVTAGTLQEWAKTSRLRIRLQPASNPCPDLDAHAVQQELYLRVRDHQGYFDGID